MQITSSLVLLALSVSSVAAGPTSHRRHQKFHEQKRALGDMVTVEMDGKLVSWANNWDPSTATAQATGVAPAATGAPAAAAPAAAAPVVAAEGAASVNVGTQANNNVATSYEPFCQPSNVKAKRATADAIAYAGNVGSTYGCNMKLIDNSIANQYSNTINFSNQHDSDQECGCWNKIGKDHGINGWFGEPSVQFSLPVGTSQTVAFDDNSLGGCTCGAGGIPRDHIGQMAGTWLEYGLGDGRTGGYSGADVSSIVAQTSGMPVQGMQLCTADGSQCSSMNAGATNVHEAFTQGDEDKNGLGINLNPGNVHLNAIVGY